MTYGQLWDAEVLIRSAFEGAFKFAYLLQSNEAFKERYREFSREQPDMAALKDDKKARELLDTVSNPEAQSWRPVRDIILVDESRDCLASKYPKKLRRQMDVKWGYEGMLSSLSKSSDTLFADFRGLNYVYSSASHIHHADFIGVSIPLDRDRRSTELRNSIHLAHRV